jgi:hypothetical protein
VETSARAWKLLVADTRLCRILQHFTISFRLDATVRLQDQLFASVGWAVKRGTGREEQGQKALLFYWASLCAMHGKHSEHSSIPEQVRQLN